MKKVLVWSLLFFLSPLRAEPTFILAQLEGAWWSDSDLSSPTAAFAVRGDQVWLDHSAQYHPCRIEDDVLVFQLNYGEVRNRIISLNVDKLVLESLPEKDVWSLTRKE